MKPFFSCDTLEEKLLPTTTCQGPPRVSSSLPFKENANSDCFVFNSA